jgi:hypothetical protein
MSEEFNAFLARQMKLHAKRVGMKKGGAHPYSWHSAKAAAFEAWENRQKIIEQQQAQIEQLLAIVHCIEDAFATYSVEFKHGDPRGSMKRLVKTVEKMALDPAISHRANKLMINGAESYSRELMAATTSLIHPHFKGVLEAWKIKIERGEA